MQNEVSDLRILAMPGTVAQVALVEAHSSDRNLLTGFKAQFAELTKLADESRDNVKFLTTLERHFKNITFGPLPSIPDTLPPMMNALRMVWCLNIVNSLLMSTISYLQ